MNPITTTLSARQRITTALRESSRPLSSDALSMLTGVPLQQVKNILARFDEFENVGTKRAGLYVLCEPVKREPARPGVVPWRDSTYTGEKPAPHRPGADDFLQFGSIENGQRVERRRPALISSREL